MAKALIVLGKIWLWLASALILLGYGLVWWFQGIDALQEAASPSNIWNVLAVVLTLAPGFGLLKLGEYVREHRTRARL